ncbi:MAG: transporter substrate-binding domain-containing protein [Rickettsiales bacterium]|jgi:polar amino acid transport system substrate-binding protein|nr:transporter substrate-binding domain-containing protein [Rickettsiales bacterium]
MKRILCLVGVFILLSCKAERVKIVGALDPSYPPFEFYKEGTREVIGLDVDMVRAIAEELGYDVEIKDMSYGGIMPALLSKNIDFIASPITVNEERKKNVNFTHVTSCANLTILTLETNNDITGLNSLSGKKVGAKTGTTSSNVAHSIEGAEAIDFDRGDVMLLSLVTGKIDALIDERLTNEYLINLETGHAKDKVKIAGEPFNDKCYAFAIGKHNDKLADDFNRAIDSLKKSGKWKEMIDKWLEGKEDDKKLFIM